jgi:hypothetical protein
MIPSPASQAATGESSREINKDASTPSKIIEEEKTTEGGSHEGGLSS